MNDLSSNAPAETTTNDFTENHLLTELFDSDDRPTFVIDLQNSQHSIVYQNDSFTHALDIASILSPTSIPAKDFTKWAQNSTSSKIGYNFDGLIWSSTILRARWKVMTGCFKEESGGHGQIKRPALNTMQKRPSEQRVGSHLSVKDIREDSGAVTEGRSRSHDFTSHKGPDNITAHLSLVRDHDWSKIPLGPMKDWPMSLRTMANLAMTDSQPAIIFWGPQRICLYNEAWRGFIGERHPNAMGQAFYDIFPEIASSEEAVAIFDNVWSRGHDNGQATTIQDETFYMMDDQNRLRERIFSGCFYPIIGEDGETVGFWENVREITAQSLEQRRSVTLRRIGESTAGEEDDIRFFDSVVTALSENAKDVPFAIFYAVPPSKRAMQSSLANVPFSQAVAEDLMQLVGHVGLMTDPKTTEPSAHALLCDNKDVDAAVKRLQEGADPISINIAGNKPLVSALKQQTTEGNEPRGFDDTADTIVACPIITTNLKEGISGVLIIGLNTRQPYDDAYALWLKTMSRGISSALATTLLVSRQREIVEEAHRQRTEAVIEQERAMAAIEITTVGVFIMTPEGDMQYVNNAWREITGFYDEFDGQNWAAAIKPKDHEAMNGMWADAIEKGEATVDEIRLAKPWHGTDDEGRPIVGETWVKSGVHTREFGGKQVVMGSLTDISRSRWAEQQQVKLKDEAVERKRQQENFIDMTSHEMRNPLSAVFQCADAIAASLESHRNKQSNGSLSLPTNTGQMKDQREDVLSSCIDLAKTITLCAQHQKRIVDDVLVLSKVDANLIEITPVEVQPRILVSNAVKMFAAELGSVKATMQFHVDPSFDKLAVDWVKFDPGRVLQILINLCTNAIKFTAESQERVITLRLAATMQRPETSLQGVQYLDEEHASILADPTSKPEWGNGDQLYLSVQVTDTGKGMNDEEMRLLFQRFQQASPRTHTQYGGSGLGLYIARLLSRLQGGEIGVTSKPNHGSTFAFFVKVRRCEAPSTSRPTRAAVGSNIPIKVSGKGTDTPINTTPISPTDLSILIVEDNLVNQRVLSKQLRNIGFKVHTANHGQECLDFLQKTSRWISPTSNSFEHRQESRPHSVDLILMDVEMPVMNGIVATKFIRGFEERDQKMGGHVPIVAITGNARHEQVQEVIDAGMDRVLSKPFRVQELLVKLEGFVGPIDVEAK